MQPRDFQEAFKRIIRRYDHSLGNFSSTHWACVTTGRSGWAVEEMAVTQRFQSCGGCLFFIFADLLYLKMTYKVFSHTTCLAAYWTRAVSPVFSVGIGARLRRYLDNWRSGFPGGSVVKIPSANEEIQVWFLGWEDPLDKEMATNSSILACEIPRAEEPGRLQSMGSQKSQTWYSD